MNKKKLYVETQGCQMNVDDTERMVSMMKRHGFEIIDHYSDADLVIINTCHIREKATEKLFSELGRYNIEKQRMKAQGRDMCIVVAGCVAQALGSTIKERAQFVNIIVGPQSYHTLPQMVTEISREQKWSMNLDFEPDAKFDEVIDIETKRKSSKTSAFVTVQEGCNEFCNFCVVPYTRGAEYSRPVNQIYKEVLNLASAGFKEIVFLGQNVSGYHGEDRDGKTCSLGGLIKHVAKIDGIERIRYVTSHPNDMRDEELFEVHATEPKLMPFLHLPIQSGSNKLLKTMNRKHNVDFYHSVIKKFRAARPDMAFSSDFIVGYPGETEKDLDETIALVKQIGYAQCYYFMYSIREGTPAATMPLQIPEDIKVERFNKLRNVIQEEQLKYNKSFIGQTVPVLFEKRGKAPGQFVGKSPYMQSVVVHSDEDITGKIYDVNILSTGQNSVSGVIIGNTPVFTFSKDVA